jgi:GNAT superfamily N-acetyltransferase
MIKYGMEIKIRYLIEKDLNTLKRDILKMWSDHHFNNEELISKNALENIDIKEYFKDPIRKQNSFALVALVDDQVVGIVRVDEKELEDFFVYKKAYFIDDLVVKKSFRRRGVANLLLKKVKEIAKNNNVKVLKARVYTFNKPAQRFFQDGDFNDLYKEYFCTLD